jgi:prevent-host-death family protein
MDAKKRSYNIYEAKASLSRLVQQARIEGEVILMNRGEPVAKIVPIERRPLPRKAGFGKRFKVEILEGFGDIPEGFEEYT